MSTVFIQNLIACLEKEASAHLQLLQLLETEKQTLVKNQSVALNENLHAQEECLAYIQALGQERSTLLENFAQQKQIPIEKLTLPNLIPMIMKPQLRAQLQKIHQQLKETVEKIKLQGQTNRILIQQAMDYIDYSVDLFSEVITSNRNKVYSPYGDAQNIPEGYQTVSYDA